MVVGVRGAFHRRHVVVGTWDFGLGWIERTRVAESLRHQS